MEFAEITEDPFTNNTNNFFLVLGIEGIANLTSFPTPPGNTAAQIGVLKDPSGTPVAEWELVKAYANEVTGSLSDEAYSWTQYYRRHYLIIPPKFSFVDFSSCYGFWLSPEEIKQFILNGLSHVGGD